MCEDILRREFAFEHEQESVVVVVFEDVRVTGDGGEDGRGVIVVVEASQREVSPVRGGDAHVESARDSFALTVGFVCLGEVAREVADEAEVVVDVGLERACRYACGVGLAIGLDFVWLIFDEGGGAGEVAFGCGEVSQGDVAVAAMSQESRAV